MKKNRTLKSICLILCACLMLAMLSACGNSEKEKEAAKLIEEGKFGDAYKIYAELKNDKKLEEIHQQALEAAKTAFTAGDNEKAIGILSDFESYKDCLELLYEVRDAQDAMAKVEDVKLEGNKLTFTLIRGKDDTDYHVRVKLYADNAALTGNAVYDMTDNDIEAGDSVQVELELAELTWKASKKLGMFLIDAAVTKNTMFLGNKGIRLDGTEGISVTSTTSIQFVDPVNAFAGGTISVALYHESDGDYLETKEYAREQTIHLP